MTTTLTSDVNATLQQIADRFGAQCCVLALDAAVPTWRKSATAADAEPVLAALAGVIEALHVHLPDEEAGLNRRATIIEQWRDLTRQSLNRAVDHALGG